MIAIIMDRTKEPILMINTDWGEVDKNPSGTFIPKKEYIMVGMDNTIVAPAKNFITIFKLLETIVAYVSVIEDKMSR